MKRLMMCALVPVLLATGAAADDFEDSVEAALKAYRAGDIKAAKREIDFAVAILNQIKAAGLTRFLPAALDGWTRQDQDGGQTLADFGGGQLAMAEYRKDDRTVELQVMADNQMVTAMAAMFSSPTMMLAAGDVRRLNGQKVIVTEDGEIQAIIEGRVMVMIAGPGSIEDKEAYFKALDVDGLKKF